MYMAAVEQKAKPSTSAYKDFKNGTSCNFTAWDVTKEPTWDEKTMKYLVYQLESCPETKTLHWQGYVELQVKCRVDKVQRLLGIAPKEDGKAGGWKATQMHSRGNAYACAEYCKKPESAVTPGKWKEFGTPPEKEVKGQGHRTDLAAVAASIKAGKSMEEIGALHPQECMKYLNNIRGLITLRNNLKDRTEDPGIVLRLWQLDVIRIIDLGFKRRQIIWIWSALSETGKTTFLEYLDFKYGSDAVLPNANWKWNDLLYAHGAKDRKVLTFNIPRQDAVNDTMLRVLEQASDGGKFTCSKYDCPTIRIRGVVIVCANIPPPHDKMPGRCIEFCIDPPEVIEARRIVAAQAQALVARD
jgi:hypothetical protein